MSAPLVNVRAQKVPPLSLYVHMPWCVRKCPYCDFNSHAVSADGVPEAAYIDALLNDLDADLAHFSQDWSQRPLQSIFIGGGTPSLISPNGYVRLFAGIRARLSWADDIEITLEANPGTVEQGLFEGYRAAGINRLSIGVQTFQGEQLKALGRIHSGDEALRAASTARAAGFERINLDLMHGLPGQSVAAACDDLAQAIALGVTHLSWYQLTLEPNTVFYRQQPILPDEDVLADIQEQGEVLLAQAGFQRYEVSAFAQADQACRHNLNYWQFGDYLGIGAGAHGKLTLANSADITTASAEIWRSTKTRMPKDYLAAYSAAQSTGIPSVAAYQAKLERIASIDLPFEFMLNALRLTNGVPSAYWSERTGLSLNTIASTLAELRRQGLLEHTPDRLQASALGLRFLNRAIDAFLPEHSEPASR
ncbi:radical SAM family heme chaperone HemW [Paraperlucidibaca wandonensis]|uniref:Heme chaperone HemW n=1 Tax=Paraperlucidibaca wandonensis TaxID=1268273 RepID=A0ABW3HIL0_9GAMM